MQENETKLTETEVSSVESDKETKPSIAEESEQPIVGEVGATPADSHHDLEVKLQQAEDKAKENYDRFLRASAELENFKKRTNREIESFRKFANETLLKELLPVVDNLENAIASIDPAKKDDPIFEGIQLTLKEILRVLERSGVKAIECIEKPFDPSFHEAMMQEETDKYPENTVIREYQKGYLLHDRLLRPARVVVSKAKMNSV